MPPPPPRSSGAPVRWLMARGRRASGVASAPRSPAAGAPATRRRRAPPRSQPHSMAAAGTTNNLWWWAVVVALAPITSGRLPLIRGSTLSSDTLRLESGRCARNARDTKHTGTGRRPGSCVVRRERERLHETRPIEHCLCVYACVPLCRSRGSDTQRPRRARDSHVRLISASDCACRCLCGHGPCAHDPRHEPSRITYYYNIIPVCMHQFTLLVCQHMPMPDARHARMKAPQTVLWGDSHGLSARPPSFARAVGSRAPLSLPASQ